MICNSFSVILTVKNEKSSIRKLLDSLLDQTEIPQEIVIVDGGSSDGTSEIIQEYIQRGFPIRCLIRQGVNIAEGRNAAIENAKCEIVASVDAGCVYDKTYFQNLISPFKDPSIDVVLGVTLPEAKSLFEKCQAVYFEKPQCVRLEATSSRCIAYKKSIWKKVGGYPEWLYTAEDTVFNLKLKKIGVKCALAPDAITYWRMRSTLRKLAKQYFSYAKGDGLAKTRVPHYLALYLVYSAGLIFLIFGFIYTPIWWLLLLFGLSAYLVNTCGRAAIILFSRERSLQVFLIMPMNMIVSNLASMIGFLEGFFRKLTHFLSRPFNLA